MPTFKRRRPDIVDARQFTGGVQNGSDIALWVNSNQGRASWYAAVELYPERLRVSTGQSVIRNAYSGDWIVWSLDGVFSVMRPQDFNAEYVQV